MFIIVRIFADCSRVFDTVYHIMWYFQCYANVTQDLSQQLMTRLNLPSMQFIVLMTAFLALPLVFLPSDLPAQDENEAVQAAETTQAANPDTKPAPESSKPAASKPKQNLFWVFLSSGKSLDGVEPNTVKKMRDGHLENFKRLEDDGTLISAGSVTDPAESMQGVAIVTGEQSPLQMFKDDELVKNGFRTVNVTKMQLEYGVINAGINGRNGMQEYRMVLLEQDATAAESDTQTVVSDSRKVIKSMYEDKDFRLAVRLENNKMGRELVLVLDKPEEETGLKARLQKIPAVKSGLWKVRIIPVFFGKGTLKTS